jgi:hypothetical protein
MIFGGTLPGSVGKSDGMLMRSLVSAVSAAASWLAAGRLTARRLLSANESSRRLQKGKTAYVVANTPPAQRLQGPLATARCPNNKSVESHVEKDQQLQALLT